MSVGSLFILFLFNFGYFFAERIKPPGSLCNVLPTPPTNGLLKNKVLFYSPSIIGEDTHVSKIDLYTEFFSKQHEEHIPMIKALGATHILVGETWSTDGKTEHEGFINLCLQYNLSIIVSFTLPSGMNKLEEVDYVSLIDNRKKDFVALLNEFDNITRPNAFKAVEFFYIPPPAADKMSAKDVQDFYELVTTIKSITNDRPHSKKKLIVGVAVIPSDGKIQTFDGYGNVKLEPDDVWAMDIYSANDQFMKNVATQWNKIWSKLKKVPLVLPMIATDNYNQLQQQANDTQQEVNFCQLYNYWAETGKFKLWGMGIWEFSDEWWRSDLSTNTGFDLEGCPNGNPYAHTACGITIYQGILTLEYTGLYRIEDKPFHYCVVPKKVVQQVAYVWYDENASVGFNPNQTHCVPIYFIIHPYALGPIVVLSIISIFLILILDPPKPPTVVHEQQDVELNTGHMI